MKLPAFAWVSALLAASPAMAQDAFRCTSPEGKVSYQQEPCPKSNEERKVDVTPANTTIDLGKRDELLKKGEEAGKKLEARAAEEEAERKRRAEQRAKEEQRERETQEREEAREIYAAPGWRSPNYPWPFPPTPPRPDPRPPRPVQPGPVR